MSEVIELIKEIHEFLIDQSNVGSLRAERLLERFEEELEKPEPEPVAWMHPVSGATCPDYRKIPGVTLDDFNIPLYTQLTAQQKPLSDDEMIAALRFYADKTRYLGPNKTNTDNDEWSNKVGLNGYRLDVIRDGGSIARAALGLTEVEL